MILFCEDCGKKNALQPDHIQNGKVSFRCKECDYLNNYTLPEQKRPVIKPPPEDKEELSRQADALLSQINEIQSVFGYFIFHQQSGILQKSNRLKMVDEDLFGLGRILADNFIVCENEYPEINEIGFVYNNKIVFLIHICNNIFIAVINVSTVLPEELKSLVHKSVRVLKKVIRN